MNSEIVKNNAHQASRYLVFGIILLLHGCGYTVGYSSDFSGTVPLAISQYTGKVWVVSLWRQAAIDDKHEKQELRIHTSDIDSPSTLSLNKTINIQAPAPSMPFVAGLELEGTGNAPPLWVLGQFPSGWALKVFSKEGEQTWEVPAENAPENFDHLSLSVTHPAAGRTWITFKGSLNRTQGGLFEIDGAGLKFFPNVIWARCRQEQCHFARRLNGKLTMYSLTNHEKIDGAVVEREQSIGIVSAVCRDYDGNDRLIADGSSSSLETSGTEKPIVGMADLPSGSELFCGPSTKNAEYWLAISPNSTDTFMIDSTKGMSTTPFHFDNYAFYAVETSEAGWLIAEGKHLGSKRKGRTCDYGATTTCDDVNVEYFGLRIRSLGTDGTVR